LDKTYVRSNYVFIKSQIDRKINELLNIENNMRNELSSKQIKIALDNINKIGQELLSKYKK